MKITKTTLQLISTGILCATLITSCGNGKISSETNNGTEAVSEDNAKALQTKMNKYVEAVNKISTPLNRGYAYYLNYVNKETGAALNPAGGLYFQSPINGFDKVLADVELASKEQPSAAIDKIAFEYVSKAKTLIALHNELSSYYGTKENLADNNAKGLATHKTYISAVENFQPTAKALSDAYTHYYKEKNEAYISKLEKEGDKVRVAANRLMNEAEKFNDAFYAAIPKEGTVEMTPELEAVMQQSIELQSKLTAYTAAYKALTEEEKKYFFRDILSFNSLESDATGMLSDARTTIEYAKNKQSSGIDNYINGVGNKYSQMINSFNQNHF